LLFESESFGLINEQPPKLRIEIQYVIIKKIIISFNIFGFGSYNIFVLNFFIFFCHIFVIIVVNSTSAPGWASRRTFDILKQLLL